MQHAIIQRIVRGFGANLYGQGVVLIIQLAGVPILLHYWGVELYGEWLILFAIPAYLSITDLGFSQSAANDMTARVGRGDTAGALVVFQSLAVLVYCAGSIGLIVFTAIIFSIPLNKWMLFSQLPIDDVRWILWLLGAEVLVRLSDGINFAGFRSQGEYGFHLSIFFSTLLLQNLALWLVAANAGKPWLAAAIFLLIRILVSISVTALLLRRHTALKLGLQHANVHTLGILLRPALANLAMPLSMTVNLQGMILMIGALLGPTAVVTFSTLRTLTRMAAQMIISVSNAVEPEFARAWGLGNQLLLRQLFVRGLGYSIWLAIAAAILLLTLGDWIVAIWTSGHVTMDRALFGWLLSSAVASVLWCIALGLLKGGNLHLRASLWFLIASASGVALAAVFVQLTGRLADAGIALLLTDALMAVYLLKAASAHLAIAEAQLLLDAIDPRLLFRSFIFWNHNVHR
ncbi:hypothetical protein [uncultured Thiodictyon sp.]|uniref:lipopolysaccharide biosynthesis protein n=1 Tax=uncultured Thiodictyon sp. TaxID=1846217 RepID=UPI0025ED8322|nr:hypothetical protein [uncultured Thiodictyon sp.]